MNKEEAINDFLKGLRIVLNTASAYNKDHPYFKKSIENFKQKVDMLFSFLNPIKINIAPNYLFIDGKRWEKAIIYADLASMFHLRKVKSIEIREGLDGEELTDFLSAVSLPVKEILKQGGLQNILNKEKNPHFSIEELDYSELLRSEGEEYKDIWVYLLGESVKKQDTLRISTMADNFERIIGKFKGKDLLENEELRKNLYNFLVHLKHEEKDRFHNCTKGLFRFVLRDKSVSQEDNLDKISAFFKDLNKEDLSQALLDELSKEEGLDYSSVQLFLRLFEEDVHKEVAPTLKEKLKASEFLKNNPRIRKKIKELFSGISDSSHVLEPYRHAFYFAFEDSVQESSFSFESDDLPKNYYFVLLNLISEEENREDLTLISKRLLPECNKIIEEKNLGYLKFLFDILDKRIKEDPSLSSVFEELDKYISSFIENAVFEEEAIESLEYFVNKLNKSFLGFNFYLDKMFNEGKVNSYVLKLLLKFFPEKLPFIYENFEKKYLNIDFMYKFVKSLEKIDPANAIEILKKIFSFSNNIIKIEILKSMQNLSIYDDEFLFPILEKKEFYFRKEALLILVRDANYRKIALEKLFSIRSPWGRNNKVIIENIILIENTKLEEAKEYLVSLSRKPFFWNKNIRKKAQEVLQNWNVRKD